MPGSHGGKLMSCKQGILRTFSISSPIGDLEAISCPSGLHKLTMASPSEEENFKPNMQQPVKVKETLHSGDMHNYQPLQKCVDWLRVFFKSPQKTATLPLPPICYLATERSDSGSFTERVWYTLTNQVGVGETVSYGELAKLSGSSPAASRAVGQAMRTNNVMLIIPCHRVILANGETGNYGGGKRNSVKSWLLQHEKGH